jgi:DNA-binding transcriptional ArsR family regulator
MERRRCIDGAHAVDPEEIARCDLQTCIAILTRLSKGLAHPVRIEIVRMLYRKPPEKRYICADFVDALPLSQASVSQHLKVLSDTGWVYRQIDGPRVSCSLVVNITEYYTKLVRRVVREAIT